jgi:hypothetical protein
VYKSKDKSTQTSSRVIIFEPLRHNFRVVGNPVAVLKFVLALRPSCPETGFQEVAKRIGVTQSFFVLEQAGSLQGDGHPERTQPSLCRQLGEKAAQFRRRFELWNRIELLERAGEGVREAPHGPRCEFRVLWLEIQTVDFGEQGSGRFQFAVKKRRIED